MLIDINCRTNSFSSVYFDVVDVQQNRIERSIHKDCSYIRLVEDSQRLLLNVVLFGCILLTEF